MRVYMVRLKLNLRKWKNNKQNIYRAISRNIGDLPLSCQISELGIFLSNDCNLYK
jgi:hypothetical protein